MTSTIKKLPKSQVEITIQVPYSDYLVAEKDALQEISKQLKIDGFRPGHVPENIIREKVPASTLQASTIEKIIPKTYTQAVKEHDLFVIAHPKIEVKNEVQKENDELVYIATVSIMPEVKLGNYKKIKVKKKEVSVGPKEVDETIQLLMARFGTWHDVDRPAKNEDRVELDFEGFDQDGKAIPNTASKNHPVVLGSKTMIPGFEEQVLGMQVGQEKEFDIEFPKDYHAAFMQGQKVKFKLKLNRLEEKEPQLLDEAMTEKISGQKQSVEAFKKRIEEDLLAEMQQRAQVEIDNNVIQEIVKMTQAELPDSLVEDEIALLKQERQRQVAQQGLTWEQYLSHVKKTEEDFKKDHWKSAEERLLARLAVNHIIKQENIQAHDQEVEAKIQEIIARYPLEARDEALAYYKKDSEGYRQLKNNLAADKLIRMFVE